MQNLSAELPVVSTGHLSSFFPTFPPPSGRKKAVKGVIEQGGRFTGVSQTVHISRADPSQPPCERNSLLFNAFVVEVAF